MTDFWKDDPEMADRLEAVGALIEKTVTSRDFPLDEQVGALADSNGKMLRPALLLIGAGFGRRADESQLLSLAAAVEILHVSTLIHDDVIDDAVLRRGRPALHTTLGVKEAVLAGDWLFSRAFLLSASSSAPGNARALARVIAAICASEISQDLDKWKYSTSVRSYLRKISGKTAALFSLSLQTGAQESKAPREVIQSVRRCGYDIGMAFQIMDDVLDFESSEGVMRKPVGKDIAEGLCTLPLIHALRRDEVGMRSLLSELRLSPIAQHAAQGASVLEARCDVSSEAVARVIARSVELGGVEESKKEVERFTARARREIARLPRSASRARLESLAERLLNRQY